MNEEEKNEMVEVDEIMIEDEISGDAGSMLVIAGILAVGAVIGIGMSKLGKFVKGKIQDWKEREKEIVVVEATEETEA